MESEDLDALALELQRVYADFTLYCCAFLVINTKEHGKQPLVPNNAQAIVIDILFKQYREKGHVKAVILKARQMGISTIIQAIFYYLTTTLKGVKTEVISHEKDSAQHIFSMAETFLQNMPEELRPARSTHRSGRLWPLIRPTAPAWVVTTLLRLPIIPKARVL